MIEKNKKNSKKTCEYKYSNYKLISYENGNIDVQKEKVSFLIRGNLQYYGINKITSMFVIGERGERELILEEHGNSCIILNFENILDTFRILFGKRSRQVFESG